MMHVHICVCIYMSKPYMYLYTLSLSLSPLLKKILVKGSFNLTVYYENKTSPHIKCLECCLTHVSIK